MPQLGAFHDDEINVSKTEYFRVELHFTAIIGEYWSVARRKALHFLTHRSQGHVTIEQGYLAHENPPPHLGTTVGP